MLPSNGLVLTSEACDHCLLNGISLIWPFSLRSRDSHTGVGATWVPALEQRQISSSQIMELTSHSLVFIGLFVAQNATGLLKSLSHAETLGFTYPRAYEAITDPSEERQRRLTTDIVVEALCFLLRKASTRLVLGRRLIGERRPSLVLC